MHNVRADISEKQVSIKERFFSRKTAFSFLLGFTVLYFLYTRIDSYKVEHILEKTNWGLLVFGFILFYFSIYLRGIRWQLLLRNIGVYGDKWSIIEILFISWFTNVIVPAKIGDLYRSYLMKRNYRFSISKIIGSVFAERVFDMLVLFVLFGISGLYSFKGKLPGPILYLVLSGFAMATVLIVALLIMKYFSSSIKGILPKWMGDIYARFEVGALGSIKKIPSILAYTLIIWLLEGGTLFLVTMSLQLNLSIILIIFIALGSSLLTALPITPAGLGFVEFEIVGILVLFGIDKNMAVSVAILDRVISYWSVIVLGYLTFVLSNKL